VWGQSYDFIITETQKEISKIDSEISGLKSKLADLGQVFKGEEQEYDQNKTNHDRIQQQWDQNPWRVDFNNNCANRTMYGDAYLRCKALQEGLQIEKNNLERTLKPMEDRGNELRLKHQQTSNAMVLAQARIQKLTNYRSWLQVRLEQIRQGMVSQSQCKGVLASASLEELKHKCGNIQFDRAKVSLPPCTTDECVKFDALYK